MLETCPYCNGRDLFYNPAKGFVECLGCEKPVLDFPHDKFNMQDDYFGNNVRSPRTIDIIGKTAMPLADDWQNYQQQILQQPQQGSKLIIQSDLGVTWKLNPQPLEQVANLLDLPLEINVFERPMFSGFSMSYGQMKWDQLSQSPIYHIDIYAYIDEQTANYILWHEIQHVFQVKEERMPYQSDPHYVDYNNYHEDEIEVDARQMAENMMNSGITFTIPIDILEGVDKPEYDELIEEGWPHDEAYEVLTQPMPFEEFMKTISKTADFGDTDFSGFDHYFEDPKFTQDPQWQNTNYGTDKITELMRMHPNKSIEEILDILRGNRFDTEPEHRTMWMWDNDVSNNMISQSAREPKYRVGEFVEYHLTPSISQSGEITNISFDLGSPRYQIDNKYYYWETDLRPLRDNNQLMIVPSEQGKIRRSSIYTECPSCGSTDWRYIDDPVRDNFMECGNCGYGQQIMNESYDSGQRSIPPENFFSVEDYSIRNPWGTPRRSSDEEDEGFTDEYGREWISEEAYWEYLDENPEPQEDDGFIFYDHGWGASLDGKYLGGRLDTRVDALKLLLREIDDSGFYPGIWEDERPINPWKDLEEEDPGFDVGSLINEEYTAEYGQLVPGKIIGKQRDSSYDWTYLVQHQDGSVTSMGEYYVLLREENQYNEVAPIEETQMVMPDEKIWDELSEPGQPRRAGTISFCPDCNNGVVWDGSIGAYKCSGCGREFVNVPNFIDPETYQAQLGPEVFSPYGLTDMEWWDKYIEWLWNNHQKPRRASNIEGYVPDYCPYCDVHLANMGDYLECLDCGYTHQLYGYGGDYSWIPEEYAIPLQDDEGQLEIGGPGTEEGEPRRSNWLWKAELPYSATLIWPNKQLRLTNLNYDNGYGGAVMALGEDGKSYTYELEDKIWHYYTSQGEPAVLIGAYSPEVDKWVRDSEYRDQINQRTEWEGDQLSLKPEEFMNVDDLILGEIYPENRNLWGEPRRSNMETERCPNCGHDKIWANSKGQRECINCGSPIREWPYIKDYPDYESWPTAQEEQYRMPYEASNGSPEFQVGQQVNVFGLRWYDNALDFGTILDIKWDDYNKWQYYIQFQNGTKQWISEIRIDLAEDEAGQTMLWDDDRTDEYRRSSRRPKFKVGDWVEVYFDQYEKWISGQVTDITNYGLPIGCYYTIDNGSEFFEDHLRPLQTEEGQLGLMPEEPGEPRRATLIPDTDSPSRFIHIDTENLRDRSQDDPRLGEIKCKNCGYDFTPIKGRCPKCNAPAWWSPWEASVKTSGFKIKWDYQYSGANFYTTVTMEPPLVFNFVDNPRSKWGEKQPYSFAVNDLKEVNMFQNQQALMDIADQGEVSEEERADAFGDIVWPDRYFQGSGVWTLSDGRQAWSNFGIVMEGDITHVRFDTQEFSIATPMIVAELEKLFPGFSTQSKTADITQNDIADDTTYRTDLNQWTQDDIHYFRERDKPLEIEQMADNSGNVAFVYNAGEIYWGQSISTILSQHFMHDFDLHSKPVLTGHYNLKSKEITYEDDPVLNSTPELKKSFEFKLRQEFMDAAPVDEGIDHSNEEIYDIKMH